jgi:hypothetical protein
MSARQSKSQRRRKFANAFYAAAGCIFLMGLVAFLMIELSKASLWLSHWFSTGT